MTKRPARGKQPDPARRPVPAVADLPGRLRTGFGSPEGAVPAGPGTLYQDTDPNGSGTVYRKTTAAGKTGWVDTSVPPGGSGSSAFAGMMVELENDSTGALVFSAVAWDAGGAHLDSATGRVYIDALGIWTADLFVDFQTADNSITDGILEAVLELHDASGVQRATGSFAPLAYGSPVCLGQTTARLPPFEVDTSLVGPYVVGSFGGVRQGSTDSVAGRALGSVSYPAMPTRMAVYRIG